MATKAVRADDPGQDKEAMKRQMLERLQAKKKAAEEGEDEPEEGGRRVQSLKTPGVSCFYFFPWKIRLLLPRWIQWNRLNGN
jgi:hypothetical protein